MVTCLRSRLADLSDTGVRGKIWGQMHAVDNLSTTKLLSFYKLGQPKTSA